MMFEDLAIGMGDGLGDFTFTAGEIKRFALRYDPQPFHVDEVAAARSHFGGLVASGWHVAAVWMKLTVGYHERQRREAEAVGRVVGRLGPSPGFRDMRWAKPVRAGDSLTYRFEIASLKTSASRPAWGIVGMHNTASNEAGEEAFSFEGVVFWERRGAA